MNEDKAIFEDLEKFLRKNCIISWVTWKEIFVQKALVVPISFIWSNGINSSRAIFVFYIENSWIKCDEATKDINITSLADPRYKNNVVSFVLSSYKTLKATLPKKNFVVRLKSWIISRIMSI